MGDYLCVASNGIPPPTSKKYRIHVNCKSYQNTPYIYFTDTLISKTGEIGFEQFEICPFIKVLTKFLILYPYSVSKLMMTH